MIAHRHLAALALPVWAFGCAPAPEPPPLPVVDIMAPALPSPHLRDPRRVEGELVLTFADIRPLSGERLAADNATLRLPPDKPPELHVWMPRITERFAQRDVEILEIAPPPDSESEDAVNQNRILHWDLTGALTPGNTVTLRQRFAATLYAVAFQIDPARVRPPERDSALWRFYTKPERLIEADAPEIVALAAEITRGSTAPLEQAQRLFLWVCDQMEYRAPLGARGALAALHERAGDCSQYALLFVALCRARGIPARLVSGFFFGDRTGHHVWSEFHLHGIGWIPADPSEADREPGGPDAARFFAHLPNDRLVTSAGTNIPLEPNLPWARWGNAEIDQNVTDFLQLWAQAGNGFDAAITPAVRALRSEPIPVPVLD